MNEELLAECCTYFQARPVFRRVFEKFRVKMVSLGHFGGEMTLSGLTREEINQLEGFLQKNCHGTSSCRITAKQLQHALEGSRFQGLEWEQILEAYWGESLIGKQEQKQQKKQEWDGFFTELLGEANDLRVQAWLQGLLESGASGSRLLKRQYQEDRQRLKRVLLAVFQAASQLPADRGCQEALPVFAARVTGNPHFFDEGSTAGTLLELFLVKCYGLVREEALSGPEWRSRILYQAGILRDGLSNYVLCRGIHGRLRECVPSEGVCRDGSLHEGIESYWRREESQLLTLQTLGTLSDAWGREQVYLVENPAVFSVLAQRNPQASLVCTNGVPRLASLVLLDFLSRHGTLWYAGDFDPEGLLIAQQLHRRYPKTLHYWEYQPALYQKALSEVPLEESRLKKLDQVTDEELQPMIELMRKTKRAAYQEKMLEWAYQL